MNKRVKTMKISGLSDDGFNANQLWLSYSII
jgi:hypothetical protein